MSSVTFTTWQTRTPAAVGASGNVNGFSMAFCGAQALGIADIGAPEWVEKASITRISKGISVSKILGFLKPKFSSIYENGAVEDFGVINVYCAQWRETMAFGKRKFVPLKT